MPVEEFDGTKKYKVEPALPTSLEHTPVYAMPYQKFDGMYRKSTDARYLSVGVSQWSADDISLKIMRHTKTWSRQSEEIPLHRVIDSAIFLTKVLLDRENGQVELERNLFTDQRDGLRITKERVSKAESESFDTFVNEHGDDLKARLNRLHQLLDSLKTQGKL